MAKTKDLLPVSLQGDRNIEALCEAQDHVFSLEDQLFKLLIYPRIDELSGEVLDLLAWQFHVEGWNLAETETEKRKLIKEAIATHRIKGTLAGIKYALKLCGAELLRIILPKDKIFLSLSLADKERQLWYSQFPELRITNFSYMGKQFVRYKKNFLTASLYPYISDAFTRYGVRAYIKKQGSITPLLTEERKELKRQKEVIKIVNIKEKGKAFGFFYRGKDRFVCDQEARKRVFNIKLADTYTDYEETVAHHIIYPSEQPLDIRYEIVSEKGKRYKKLSFCDYLQGHTTITDARMRLYRRLYLYDENVLLQKRNAFCFLNEKPIRIPPYNAELKVAIRDRMKFLKFPRKTEKTTLKNCIYMLNEMRAFRDRLYLDTRTKRQPVADGTVTAGMNISTREVINV